MSQSGPRRRRTLTFSNHSALQQLSLQQLLRLGNNQCQLLHFIALRGSQDQPSAHEFTNFIRLQPYCWNQRWHGHGCSHVRYCDSHCESRTGWCSYLQPELQAASRGWRGWAKRTLLSFPEVSHRWASNRTWLSIILASIPGSMIVKYAVLCRYQRDFWASESLPSLQSRPAHGDHIQADRGVTAQLGCLVKLVCYYILLRITARYYRPEGSNLIW